LGISKEPDAKAAPMAGVGDFMIVIAAGTAPSGKPSMARRAGAGDAKYRFDHGEGQNHENGPERPAGGDEMHGRPG
jgi:hypothetical protein